jgi:superfamily I DNA and/or RNA helicase/predicted DNA-binding WGR domain protein
VEYFKQFIGAAFDNGDYATDDVIAFVLPLFTEVLGFHEEGRVAPFEREESLFITDKHLDIDEDLAHAPSLSKDKLKALFQQERTTHFNVVGNVKMDLAVGEGHAKLDDLHIHLQPNEPFRHPVYLPGYGCYEIKLGHHDDLTDIFCLGLVLGSMALGLNLYEEEDLKQFVAARTNPVFHNPRIHPTISTLITEMTELDRAKRCQDLYDVINRLEHYRDFDPEKQIDLTKVAGWRTKEAANKGQFILGKLRNRLFDTSRRNRLLYYKPNMRFVNLTVSSVPMVLHYQSIRPELLFTWNAEISGKVKDMKEIVLNKYLRFDDHPYLTASLDKVRVEARHDIQEYGFSQLKLVIAFLNWHNLREDIRERIQSPLLLIPVELKKNKKLKEDHYVMKVLANEAEVNPVVANSLRELYGIRLPDFIDLDDTTVEAFFAKLKEQIDHANQGITIQYIDKPRIKLVHTVARQTVNNYKKRSRKTEGQESYRNISYSYQPEQYKPLGLEIFRQRVEPRATLLEFLINDDIHISTHHLTGEKERQLFELAESESNPYSWDVDVCNIVLGNFNYKKMSLVRDYNQVIDTNLHHPVFEHLFSDQPRKYGGAVYDLNDPASWHHVISADPTQTRAILQARSGDSYIIQGPPGTGKSQTITNLIADFISQGKSILFVCEKRAALDVVFYRLTHQGLDELCCYIHDSQGDKREFIRNLKTTYEDFIKHKHDLVKIEAERKALLEKIAGQLSMLSGFHQFSTQYSGEAGQEVRTMIERMIALKEHLVALPAHEEELLPHYSEWKEFGENISQLSRLLEETGSEPYFAGHPLSKLREEAFLSEDLHHSITKTLQLLDQILLVYAEQGITGAGWESFSSLRHLIEDADLLFPLAEQDNIKLADAATPESKAFAQAFAGYKKLEQSLKEAKEKTANWTNRFSEQDVLAALPVVQANEHSLFRFFNSSWRKIKKTINTAYDFSRHQVRPSYSSVLEALKEEYALTTAVKKTGQELEQRFRIMNLEAANLGIEKIQSKKEDREVNYLLHHPHADNLVRRLHTLHHLFWELETLLKQLLYDYDGKTVDEIKDDLENILANAESLAELLPALKNFSLLSARFKKAIRQLPLLPETMEAVIANKTLQHIYRYKKDFENADGPRLEAAVEQIGSCFRQLLKINALYIRARVRQRFLNNLELSNRALSQLGTEEKKFKKAYTEGRKILENEFGKSMRYKSIRELAAKESGLVIKDIKPVWLMSPLSVSDSLPLDTAIFDVVIFDEASQITPEEGIPSLYRAPQTIIVGDDKQMPPTNFFTAKTEDPDDLEITADDDDDILSNDADSLLVQGARKLDSVMLGWHYRSRYETLISYSNHAFYDAGLLTIPDRTIHHEQKDQILVHAPEEASQHTNALFDRSISFHFLPYSVYEKRVNNDEARYIAHMVRELLKIKTADSIGIVAFSQEQQHTIEDALTALAAVDKDFEQLLEAAYQRTENDQYVGLFVKNLENVQGDERDIIIMSICYGFDARKRMIMNFGPINRKGGEKRLNVIFSRAKKHMAVISSIRHGDIKNEYNEGANYFRRFLHYAEEVSTGNMTMARAILDSLVMSPEKIRDEEQVNVVLSQIKQALEKEGFEVATHIGQSGFKCSLGIKQRKEDEDYTLGILLDDEQHYANENILEQYYQRPAILKDFGWRTISVFAKDWLRQPARVLAEIRKRMHESPVPLPDQVPALSSFELEKEAEAVKDNGAPSTEPATGLYSDLAYRRFVFSDGSSHKFWEAATDGLKMVVRFGRVGTRGQVQVKTFGTAARVEEEKEKMIREKTAKGYKEVNGS